MKIIILMLITFSLMTVFYPLQAQGIIPEMLTDSLRFITASGETYKFKWLGTNQGVYMINKRNGKQRFLTIENSKLPDNYVTSIACCSDGHTYVATKKGILFWDNFAFFLYNTENSDLPENDITSLSLDSKENLIIRTPNCGLLKAIGHCIKVFRMHKVDE